MISKVQEKCILSCSASEYPPNFTENTFPKATFLVLKDTLKGGDPSARDVFLVCFNKSTVCDCKLSTDYFSFLEFL